jgi:hypothetical protein
MSDPYAYLQRVEDLVASLASSLSEAEQRDVSHLIDHGEPTEGLRTLAWIIVEGNKRVPRSAIALIYELTSELIEREDLPRNLDDHAAD